MLDSSAVQSILQAADANFDAQLQFTQELVRQPSVRGAERGAQDLVCEALQARGLAVDRWRIDVDHIKHHPGFGPVTVSYENAFNVVGSYRPEKSGGRSLILNGHIDVVPTGPASRWTRSPWEPTIVDGWMYGRGAGDMKAGIAANLFAFDAVRRAGFAPRAPIYIQSVVEEECTGNGALAALLRGYEADAVIIPEPQSDALVRANAGVLWFKVHVQGRPAHTRSMQSGLNAIDAAYTLIAALRKLEAAWNAEQHRHRHFEHLAHPLNFNVGAIAGGDWPSTVPAWCNFDVRIATYPGTSADSARAAIESCIAEAAVADGRFGSAMPRVEWTGFYAEGYVLEEGSDAENLLRECHRQVYRAELESHTVPAYLDARVFVIYGDMPTLVYGPAAKDIHGFDECVDLASVRTITKSIALFIAGWTGI